MYNWAGLRALRLKPRQIARCAARQLEIGGRLMQASFIVFEGGEGSGKSTQLRLLAEALRARGAQVVTTQEPGGTAAGAALRVLLLHQPLALSPLAEALLFCAARAQHVLEVIRPALATGKIVLSDRYELSTLVYQGYAGGLWVALAERLNEVATGGLHPDLTVILDLDPEVGLARSSQPKDRIETRPLDFHRRVREGYLAWARAHPEQCLVLDATRPPEELHAALLRRLGLDGPP
jgi:dTMP kinase